MASEATLQQLPEGERRTYRILSECWDEIAAECPEADGFDCGVTGGDCTLDGCPKLRGDIK